MSRGTTQWLEFLLQGGFIRVQQVVQMGKLEGQRIVTGQRWEEVKKGGDDAVKRWINTEMNGKTCLVVLGGSNTASRPWVRYEIKKAWNDKLGLLEYGFMD
jgi:hypothetical protein